MAMDIHDLEHWHFELTESACNALLELVIKGKKRATSSSLSGYQITGEAIPEMGNCSVITDWDGHPKCVIRTTNVQILPYKDITIDMAKLEGEDDTLESWQRNHEHLFIQEGKALGYTFSEDMLVIFETFEVIELIG